MDDLAEVAPGVLVGELQVDLVQFIRGEMQAEPRLDNYGVTRLILFLGVALSELLDAIAAGVHAVEEPPVLFVEDARQR